jgi:peptidoglycan/LPS O-acetylase OafA/YrhL
MDERSTGNTYLPSVEGVRALTVLAVILSQTGLLPALRGGFSGADVFFVISGFIISLSVTRSVMSGGREVRFFFFLGRFYLNRIRRLLPALLASFIPCVILSLTPGSGNPFDHLAFLGLLVQFYFIFPLLFFFWLYGGRGSGSVMFFSRFLLPLLFAASLAANLAWGDDFLPGLLPVRFWEFSAGIFLYFVQSRWNFLAGGRSGGAYRLLPPGLILILVGFFLVSSRGYPLPWALLPVGGTLLLLWGTGGGADQTTLFHNFLVHPSLIFWGKRSYSLYLWHWPVFLLMARCGMTGTFFRKILTLFLIYLAGSLSYHFIERPLRYKRNIPAGGPRHNPFSHNQPEEE